MIKALLRRWAWWILKAEIEKGYIPKGVLNEYTQWMSRDFPIMNDTYEYFQKYGSGKYGTPICRHRSEMEKKYPKSLNDEVQK